MKIVFRVNYHTLPGQSLWLKLATSLEGRGNPTETILPLDQIKRKGK